ncbi:MAG: hypothetical protein SGJ18_10590 [Pseudomonadota bacterium]|nr:hypothetical protein [Pseudomonadota bacterium]
MSSDHTKRQTNRVIVNLEANAGFKRGEFKISDLREQLRKESYNGNLEEVIAIHGMPPVKIERIFP